MAGAQQYFSIRPSRLLGLLLFTLSVAILVVLWLLSLPHVATLLMTVVILSWSSFHFLLDANLSLAQSCVAFKLEGQDEITMTLGKGTSLTSTVLSCSLVTPYIVILNVQVAEQRKRRSLVILPDSMLSEDFRRLRVLLRWGGKANQEDR